MNKVQQIADRMLSRFARNDPQMIRPQIPIIPTWEIDKPVRLPRDFRRFGEEGYRQNVIIFSCIIFISNLIARPPLVLKRKRKSDTTDIVTDHPLTETMKKPNPDSTGADFLKETSCHLEVGGDAYWLITRSNAGIPVRYDLLSPQFIDPVAGSDGSVKAYQYAPAGAPETIDAKDVVHFQYNPDPLNRYRGLSFIGVARRQGDLDNRLADYLLALINNSGIPGGVLQNTKFDIEPKTRSIIRQDYQEKFSRKQAGKLLILDPPWEFKMEGMTPRAMDISTLLAYSESRLCGGAGVHPALIFAVSGVENLTYNNYEGAWRSCIKGTMEPKFTTITQSLDTVAAAFDSSYFWEFDLTELAATSDEIESRHKRAREAYDSGGITLNQFLAETGRAPVDGGDVYKIPSSVMFVPAHGLESNPQKGLSPRAVPGLPEGQQLKKKLTSSSPLQLLPPGQSSK